MISKRWVVICGIATTIGAMWAIPRFVIEGLIVPVRIHGDSMASSHLGKHRHMECRACGIGFDISADNLPRSNVVRCANCLALASDGRTAPIRAAHRVSIAKWPLLLRSPGRWEVVAINSRNVQAPTLVKRIVGLPGEEIGLVDGDIVVDGRTLAMPWQLATKLQSIVNDDSHRRNDKSRWATAATDWAQTAIGFHIDSVSDEPQWLRYIHEIATSELAVSSRPSAVLDDCVFNQGTTRSLFPVRDLSLSGKIDFSGDGEIWMRYGAMSAGFDFVFSTQRKRLELRRGGLVIGVATIPGYCFCFEMGYRDGLAFFRADGKVLIEAYVRVAQAPDASPLAIGARGCRCEVSQLVICRDWYVQPSAAGRSLFRLGADQYFCVGDNTAISTDSRHWGDPLERGQIEGLVVPY